MIAFLVWSAFALGFVLLGLYLLCSKKEDPKPFGFWANAEQFPVKDAKRYNHALGKLWCAYGAILFLLGGFLLGEKGSALPLLTILGTVFATLACMIVYVLKIERKYRK